MTGREIVRLIKRLRREGMSSEKILDIIEEIGAPDLREADNEKEAEENE